MALSPRALYCPVYTYLNPQHEIAASWSTLNNLAAFLSRLSQVSDELHEFRFV